MKQQQCEVKSVDTAKIEIVKRAMLKDIFNLTEIFSVLSDTTRLKITYAYPGKQYHYRFPLTENVKEHAAG